MPLGAGTRTVGVGTELVARYTDSCPREVHISHVCRGFRLLLWDQ